GSFAPRIEVEGGTAAQDGELPGGRVNYVDPGYFDVFGLRLLGGRGLNAGDVAAPDGSSAVVVNQAFVDQVLGGGAALGRRIRQRPASGNGSVGGEEPWLEIVGVVENMFVNTIDNGRPSPAFYHAVALGSEPVSIAIHLRG